jgi:oligosaccharide repeat unit polymerase
MDGNFNKIDNMAMYTAPNSGFDCYSWVGAGAFNRQGRSAYLCWLTLAALISVGIYIGLQGAGWRFATKVAVVFGLLMCSVHIIRTVRQKPMNLFAPDLLFVGAYMIIHFGYLALWLIGIVPDSEDVFFHPQLYPKTIFIVNLAIVGFLFGYVLSAPKSHQNLLRALKVPSAVWTFFGLILMLAAITIFGWYVLRVGIGTFVREGSSVVAHMDKYVQDVRLWRLRSHIFALGFGIYIISVALRHGRLFDGKLGITLFVIYLMTLILQGGRTRVVTVGIVIFLARYYLVKPIKFKWLVVIVVCSIFVFTAMRVVRDVTAFDVARMTEELQYAKETGKVKWYNLFIEAGSSVSTINLTTNLVPTSYPFWHGRSYVQSFVHIVPYLQGALIYRLGVGPAQWLTILERGYDAAGTGFSIAGEGYLNFGLIGVFLHMFVIGVALRRLYVYFASCLSLTRCLVFFISLGLFIMSVRNHVDLIIAPVVQIIVISWLLTRVFGERDATELYEDRSLDRMINSEGIATGQTNSS